MKKILLYSLLFFILVPGIITAAEAGTGFSVFIPESFYLHDSGSISLQTGLSTSIGFGNFLEIPLGFEYNKIQGFMVEGAMADGTEVEATAPWFMGDSFMPFVKLQVNIPLGPVTISAFGGGALNWNASLTPFMANAAEDVAADGEYAAFSSFDFENKLGFGWLGGASLGVTVGQITARIYGEYRSLSAPLELTGTYTHGTEGAMTGTGALSGDDAKLLIRGITLGLGGSFAF